ncbi:MAG: hypothetical protein Q9O62_12325 [Ardenticatenia bacterium]|nr:hypothetical protein [Ardenticatenia bacterium]
MWKHEVVPTVEKAVVSEAKKASSNGKGSASASQPRREEYACQMIQAYYR